MSEITREPIESLFRRWRRAIETRDSAAMSGMLTLDVRGGNAIFGLADGRDAVLEFVGKKWPEEVPNASVWHVIDGVRVVNKWKETLPGESPTGEPYDYFGISEFIYSESDQWSYMYGLPDVTGLMRVHARWRADGQDRRFPDVYPELRTP